MFVENCAFQEILLMKNYSSEYNKYVIGNNRNKGSGGKKEPGNGFALTLAIIVMCLIVVLVVLFVLPFREVDDPLTTDTNTSPATSDTATSDVTSTTPGTTSDPTGTTSDPTSDPTADPTKPTSDPTGTTDSPDFVIIPESDPVDQSYFASDTLFIGDSLTVGLQLYSGLKSNYYCFVGMSTYNAFKQPFIEKFGEPITLGEALQADGGKWKRIYLQIGVNEIYQTPESYAADYEKVIDEVLKYCPNAKIYVQSVFPMTEASAAKEQYAEYGGNKKLAGFNQKLVELCSRRHFYYVNVYSSLADANGNLPEPYAGGDGIHLLPVSYKIWVDYLCRHTAG